MPRIFQSTQPKRAATPSGFNLSRQSSKVFQSTQPKRAATGIANIRDGDLKYFNPRSPRGLRLVRYLLDFIVDGISIHAAQEGCDTKFKPLARRRSISIHAAQEGCDQTFFFKQFSSKAFQSTQPKRAATFGINIQRSAIYQFQSTQPKRAATPAINLPVRQVSHFNPRSPRGLRRFCGYCNLLWLGFQSTQPKRAATQTGQTNTGACQFQSTQPKRAATTTYRKPVKF